MSRLVLAVLLLIPGLSSATESGSSYALAGNGNCVDLEGQQFEHWFAGSMKSLYFTKDASECSCPDCERVCSAQSNCIGYSFYCCPFGVRCIVGASVLFSKGDRPSGPAPEPFSTTGPYGSKTAGPGFLGVGKIAGVDSELWSSQTGGRKCFRRATVAAATVLP